MRVRRKASTPFVGDVTSSFKYRPCSCLRPFAQPHLFKCVFSGVWSLFS